MSHAFFLSTLDKLSQIVIFIIVQHPLDPHGCEGRKTGCFNKNKLK